MKLSVIASSLILLAAHLGCSSYSAHKFSSDSADIVQAGFWATPRYRIVFAEVIIQDRSVTATYGFEHPPDYTALWVGLNFFDEKEVATLIAAGAHGRVTITDEAGNCDFEVSGPLSTIVSNDVAWRSYSSVAMRPPIGWESEPKGAVINSSQIVRLGDRDPDQWWFDRDGVVLISPQPIYLDDRGYCLELEIVVDQPLPTEIRCVPMLSGGSMGK